MPVTIEPLGSSDDLDAVLAIEARSFTNPWTRDMYLGELAKPGVSFLLLARDSAGTIVGFCSFWRVLDELHINNVAVDPSCRRQGVGAALIGAVLEESRRLQAARVHLEVRRSNTPARRLYERFGFTVAAVRRNYYTHPVEDALVLWRKDPATGRP
jgi:ribosomal-protein-alanine N-acetyltransferase